MRFPNIERSWHNYRGVVVGKKDEYVGYSDKATTPFRITKNRIKGSHKWQAVGKILNADSREAVKIIWAKDLAEMSKRLEQIGKPWVGWSDAGKVSTNRRRGLRKNRCWKGYKPVKGKRAYSKGSCRRVLKRNAYSAVATPKSLAKFFAFQKDGTTKYYTAFLPKAKEYFARGEGQEAQRLMLRRMRMERGNNVDFRRLQGNPAMFVQTMGDVEKVRRMIARGKEIQEMSYTSNGLRLLIEDPNSRHKPVPFQEFKAAFDRMDMLASRGKIPRRTAVAMLRAGLPLSRSELRENQSRLQRGLNKKMLLEMKERVSGYSLAKIVEAIKNLKKRNYNDEMVESIVVKERPGRPKDFIIIVKHRYFVNGSRIYSAGLRTEETIKKFVRVMGRKTKRIGNSDYVFNIYGVRFPDVTETGAGKLFPNNGLPNEIPLEAPIYGTLNGKKLDTRYRAVLVTKSRYGNLIKIQEMIKGSWNDVMSGWAISTLLERPSSNRLYLDAGQGWAVEGMMRALGEALIRVNYDGSKR